METILFGSTAVVLLFTLFTSWKHPHLRRMALRNLKTNKIVTTLTITGSMVGTALITTSMLLAGSVKESGDRFFQEQFGEISHDLPANGQKKLARPYFTSTDISRMKDALKSKDSNIEGVLPIAGSNVTLIKPDMTGKPLLLSPKTHVFGFDRDQAKQFDRAAMMAVPEKIGPDEIVLSSRSATKLEARSGDRIILIDRQGGRRTLTVKKVVAEQGLTGYRGIQKSGSTAIVSLDTARSVAKLPEQSFTNLLLKNRSDFLSEIRGLVPSSQPTFQTSEINGWLVYHVRNIARLELDNIFRFIPFFFVASSVAIFIGILLIYNIFKMTTEERRQEWGVLRAIGMTRTDLSRLLRMEGIIYALVSSGIGVITGIGLANLLLQQLKEPLSLMAQYNSELVIRYEFFADPGSLALSFSVGVLLVTLCVSRVARSASKRPIVDALQVIDRRKDTAERARGQQTFMKTAGTLIFSVATGSLLLVTSTDGYRELIGQTSIEPFMNFAVGFLLVVMSVFTLILLLPRLLSCIGYLCRPFPRLSGILKVAFRYPEVYRKRTGLLLMMFSFVLFLTSFSSVFISSFTQYFGQFDTRKIIGGYDLFATTPGRLTTEDLNKIIQSSGYVNPKEIDTALSVLNIEVPEQSINGIDSHFARTNTIKLVKRDSAYKNDREVWEKIAKDPDYLVVSEAILDFQWDPDKKAYFPREKSLDIGDTYSVMVDGQVVSNKKIIGIAQFEKENYGYSVTTGVWMKESEILKIPNHQHIVQSHLLIRAGSKEKLREVQKGLEKTLNLNNIFGLRTPKEQYLVSNLFLRMFFSLFEGFNALGTFIGIAGLMVIMFRLIRERRQQIGVLRAIGMSSRSVFASILIEGAAVAWAGILLGIFIGSYSGTLMVRSLSTSGSVAVAFPWLKLSLYFGGAFLLTLLCAMVPARGAIRLSPAEATRYVG